MSQSQNPPISLTFLLLALMFFLIPACSGAEPALPSSPGTEEIDADSLLPLAAERCNSVTEEMVVKNRTPEGPIFSVVQKVTKLNDGDEDGGWKYFDLGSPADIAQEASEVKTVVCIKERKSKTSITYMGGGVGIRLDWDVYLIDGETGELIALVETFKGTDPPDYSRSGATETYGTEPEQDLVRRWILDQIPSN